MWKIKKKEQTEIENRIKQKVDLTKDSDPADAAKAEKVKHLRAVARTKQNELQRVLKRAADVKKDKEQLNNRIEELKRYCAYFLTKNRPKN